MSTNLLFFIRARRCESLPTKWERIVKNVMP